jgi:hypothetical protein
MRKMNLFLLAFLLALPSVAAYGAMYSGALEVRIADDPGGEVSSYIAKYEDIKARGKHVRIDGPCLSACTLLLGILPKSQMCATPNAVLGFHMASYYDDASRGLVLSKEGTKVVMRRYPSGIKSWIRGHGGLKPNVIELHGKELAKFVPPC